MPVTFRELTSKEERILRTSLNYWIAKNPSDLLDNYQFIIGEGHWRELFLTNENTIKLFKDTSISPYSIGLGFGEYKRGKLLLSLSGSSFISKLTDKKAIVTEAGEQAFLYRRDILNKSICQINSTIKINEKLIVLNQQKDALGLGRLIIEQEDIRKNHKKDQIAIKNIIDLGWYLRKGG